MKPLSEMTDTDVVINLDLEASPPYVRKSSPTTSAFAGLTVICCKKDDWYNDDNLERFEIPRPLAYYFVQHWGCTLKKMEERNSLLKREGARAVQVAIKKALDMVDIS